MKTYTVLFQFTGENLGTAPSPKWEFDPTRDADRLSEKKVFCQSFDDDRPVISRAYETREVTLPDWISISEWVRRYSEFTFLWAELGPTESLEFPEVWQRGLLELGGTARSVVINLLRTQEFRSEFRKSLRDQFLKWAEETAAGTAKYNDPFSRRQWEILKKYPVRWNSERLYWRLQSTPADGIYTPVV